MAAPLITDNDGRPVVLLAPQWVGLGTLERMEVLYLLERWIDQQRDEYGLRLIED